MKTQTTVRVSSPAPKKPARKDSAACVSLSSYHNVKEPFEKRGRLPHSEPPMEANPPIGVNDSRSVSRDELRSCSASVRGSRGRVWSRRKWEQPARRGYLSSDPSLVKGWVTVRPCFAFFPVIVTFRPHSCLNAPPIWFSLTAREPYGARYGSRELAEWGIPERSETLTSRL